jgi:hypothetical protein
LLSVFFCVKFKFSKFLNIDLFLCFKFLDKRVFLTELFFKTGSFSFILSYCIFVALKGGWIICRFFIHEIIEFNLSLWRLFTICCYGGHFSDSAIMSILLSILWFENVLVDLDITVEWLVSLFIVCICMWISFRFGFGFFFFGLGFF